MIRKQIQLIAVLSASIFAAPAFAQVLDTDTVYPGGAANTTKQKMETINPEADTPKMKLKGKVINGQGDYYVIPDQPMSIKIRNKRKSGDGVRGKTLQIGPGLGGAIIY